MIDLAFYLPIELLRILLVSQKLVLSASLSDSHRETDESGGHTNLYEKRKSKCILAMKALIHDYDNDDYDHNHNDNEDEVFNVASSEGER